MASNQQGKDHQKSGTGTGQKQSGDKGSSQQSGTPGSGSHPSEKDDPVRHRQSTDKKPERQAGNMDE